MISQIKSGHQRLWLTSKPRCKPIVCLVVSTSMLLRLIGIASMRVRIVRNGSDVCGSGSVVRCVGGWCCCAIVNTGLGYGWHVIGLLLRRLFWLVWVGRRCRIWSCSKFHCKCRSCTQTRWNNNGIQSSVGCLYMNRLARHDTVR